MRLEQALHAVAEVTPEQFEDLRRHIDPEWIEQALHATGTATIRRRRLPAWQVVWLVIGMALFRNRSIADVVSKLNLALPGKSAAVAPSAVAQARDRLGDEPMEWLFIRTADEWAHQSADKHRWRGLALYGLDGSTLRVADSEENGEHFGYSTGHRGHSAYPLMRGVGLMALRSHLLASAAFGPYQRSELSYATELWPSVPDNSLTVVDRNFLSAHVLLGQEESLRSKSVVGVYQEMWGILLAYNLVRLEMERIADEAKVEPTRISFVAALRLITDEWLWCALAAPGAIPRHLRELRASLAALILPPRRSERRYPRAVKVKMSNYQRKRRSPTRKGVN